MRFGHRNNIIFNIYFSHKYKILFLTNKNIIIIIIIIIIYHISTPVIYLECYYP